MYNTKSKFKAEMQQIINKQTALSGAVNIWYCLSVEGSVTKLIWICEHLENKT